MSAHLSGILQLAVTVKDIARATTFYRDVLGLRLLMEGPNMAFFDCGGVRLYLACGAGAAHQSGGGSIYFRTTDIRAQCAALKSSGVEIHQEPHLLARMPGHDLWLMWIRDSEDNLLGIMEERKN
jgi:methylmalonyl-CoA/ethylmalonyl-CoA epimerase